MTSENKITKTLTDVGKGRVGSRQTITIQRGGRDFAVEILHTHDRHMSVDIRHNGEKITLSNGNYLGAVGLPNLFDKPEKVIAEIFKYIDDANGVMGTTTPDQKLRSTTAGKTPPQQNALRNRT